DVLAVHRCDAVAWLCSGWGTARPGGDGQRHGGGRGEGENGMTGDHYEAAVLAVRSVMPKAWMSVCISSPSERYTSWWRASGRRPAKSSDTMSTRKCPLPSRAPGCPTCK